MAARRVLHRIRRHVFPIFERVALYEFEWYLGCFLQSTPVTRKPALAYPVLTPPAPQKRSSSRSPTRRVLTRALVIFIPSACLGFAVRRSNMAPNSLFGSEDKSTSKPKSFSNSNCRISSEPTGEIAHFLPSADLPTQVPSHPS